jgi:hypothetical protein
MGLVWSGLVRFHRVDLARQIISGFSSSHRFDYHTITSRAIIPYGA